MNESGIYTQADLQPFAQRLQVLKTIIKKDKEEGRHPPAIVKLMMRKLEDSGKSSSRSEPRATAHEYRFYRATTTDTAKVAVRAFR